MTTFEVARSVAIERGELRVVQISDTHLDSNGAAPSRNLARIAEFVNTQLRPDLVVNTGDIVAIDPDDREARCAARAEHCAFRAPLAFLPGNHDVGEPGGQPWMGVGVTGERVAAHRAVFGEDRLLVEAGRWALVGCNSELFGSGLPEERDQWSFLESAARSAAAASRNVALFLHKPIWVPRSDPSEVALAVPEPEASRLRGLFGAHLRAVASGHLHRYRRRVRDDLVEVWAPSTAFTGQTETEPSHFEQLGVVEWHFGADALGVAFRAPVDLEERSLEDDPDLVATLEAFRARREQGGHQ